MTNPTSFDQLRDTWNHLGHKDPLWAILSDPAKRHNRWQLEQFFETGRHEIDSILERVRQRVPNLPRGRALDFGCGVGRLTRALAPHFDEVVGIDVAASMIDHARQLNAELPNVSFVLNERTDLSVIDSGSVDLLYSNIVLQHIARPIMDGYVREFVRVLAPHGLAVFQIPYEHKLVYRSVPQPLRDALRRMRYGRKRMQMHAMPVADVERLVTESRGRIAHTEESGTSGHRWKSKLYFVQPEPPAPTDAAVAADAAGQPD